VSVPTLAEVLEQLRAGAEYYFGGGRWNQTFSWKDGKLMRHTFDEGLDIDEEITEADLAQAIANNKDFRRI
jgi:hypothetical protein